MLPDFDNAVRLMDSEESLQDLCAQFLSTDQQGRPWLDFGKVVMARHEQMEAAIRRRLAHTPEAVSQEDLIYLRSREQLDTEINCKEEHSWRNANYGAAEFSFPSAQLLYFFNRGTIMVDQIRCLAFLLKKPLRFTWMNLDHNLCGWCYIEPDGRVTSGDSYDFESSLSLEWLWTDLAGDPRWPHTWLERVRRTSAG